MEETQLKQKQQELAQHQQKVINEHYHLMIQNVINQYIENYNQRQVIDDHYHCAKKGASMIIIIFRLMMMLSF